MASTINPLASNTAAAAGAAVNNSGTQVTEQEFLKLLVTQIQHQDPLNPMDGTQFLSQLAQFSELEQMIGINQGIQKLVGDVQGGAPATGSNTNGNGSSSSSNGTTTA